MHARDASQDELGPLIAELRPRLHRYCARMVGSSIDGEDLVQETLARAVAAWPGAGLVERPANWLFRIAHNTAIDALRARRRQAAMTSVGAIEAIGDHGSAADIRVAAAAGLGTFIRLPATPRSCVLLADVLGHSAAETADILGITVAAVKAALHRGRGRLREIVAETQEAPRLDAADSKRLRDYVDRFNARDFDALRALLAEDVQLDLVNRVKLSGNKDVAIYFGRYSEMFDWRVSAGLADGRPAVLYRDPADPSGAIGHIALLEWADGRIKSIRDFKYVPYLVDGLVTVEFGKADD